MQITTRCANLRRWSARTERVVCINSLTGTFTYAGDVFARIESDLMGTRRSHPNLCCKVAIISGFVDEHSSWPARDAIHGRVADIETNAALKSSKNRTVLLAGNSSSPASYLY